MVLPYPREDELAKHLAEYAAHKDCIRHTSLLYWLAGRSSIVTYLTSCSLRDQRCRKEANYSQKCHGTGTHVVDLDSITRSSSTLVPTQKCIASRHSPMVSVT